MCIKKCLQVRLTAIFPVTRSGCNVIYSLLQETGLIKWNPFFMTLPISELATQPLPGSICSGYLICVSSKELQCFICVKAGQPVKVQDDFNKLLFLFIHFSCDVCMRCASRTSEQNYSVTYLYLMCTRNVLECILCLHGLWGLYLRPCACKSGLQDPSGFTVL